MKKKTYNEYVNDNDFEGARERFESASNRWREYWFDACVTIMKNCKEWAQKYIIDPIKLTITRIIQAVKPAFPIAPCVYLIRMYDENDHFCFLKIGKTNNLNRRLKELSKYYYKMNDTHISRVELIKMWELPTDELAESCEKAMQHYFSKLYDRIPNDRYAPIEPKEEHLAKFDEIHTLLSTLQYKICKNYHKKDLSYSIIA